MPYAPLSSAFVLINTASAAKGGDASMAGNVEEVGKKLQTAGDKHIDLIHWLLGPNDMIAHVHADDFAMLLKIIETRILPLKNEVHNKIASTETLIVTSSRARKPFSAMANEPKQLNAWVLANTNSDNPELGFRLLDDKNVFYVGHVIGRYDMVLLIRAKELAGLMTAIDKTLRTKNYFANTDTRIVLM